MPSLKGTKTERNLLKSFAGESQARNRYTYCAAAARKEGFVQIADIFEETANQEKEHAKRFFKFLEGGDLEITALLPGRQDRHHRGKPSGLGHGGKTRNTTNSIPPLAAEAPRRRIFRDRGGLGCRVRCGKAAREAFPGPAGQR